MHIAKHATRRFYERILTAQQQQDLHENQVRALMRKTVAETTMYAAQVYHPASKQKQTWYFYKGLLNGNREFYLMLNPDRTLVATVINHEQYCAWKVYAMAAWVPGKQRRHTPPSFKPAGTWSVVNRV